MGVFEMIVSVVGIACSTGILVKLFETVQAAIVKRPSRNSEQVVEGLRAMRDEVRQLRAENSANVLNLDSTLETLDQRLTRLELRGTTAEPERMRVGR